MEMAICFEGTTIYRIENVYVATQPMRRQQLRFPPVTSVLPMLGKFRPDPKETPITFGFHLW